MTNKIAVPKKALAIGAHPDDIEFNCGGTLAKWAREGCQIFYLVLTDGRRGSWEPIEDSAGLVVTRQREQRAAHRIIANVDCVNGSPSTNKDDGNVGQSATEGSNTTRDQTSDGENVFFLSWPDGELEPGLRQRAEVCAVIRRTKPDVVLVHDPWKRYRLHPDHRNAGFLTLDGIVAARDPWFFEEQAWAPHRPSSIMLFEADEPDYANDISDIVEIKLAALLEHRSQLRTTMGITIDPLMTKTGENESIELQWQAQVTQFANQMVERHRTAGRPFGLDCAESFKLIAHQ